MTAQVIASSFVTMVVLIFVSASIRIAKEFPRGVISRLSRLIGFDWARSLPEAAGPRSSEPADLRRDHSRSSRIW